MNLNNEGKRRILLIGSGGREHAIALELVKGQNIELFVAPGNPGTATIATNVDIKATDIDTLVSFAAHNGICFTIVGPDDPLAMGIVDKFQQYGLKIFGPTKAAAQIEASKLFAKEIMKLAGISNASFEVFDTYTSALGYMQNHFSVSSRPLVVKADGLALGKGVTICRTLPEAEQALDECMVRHVHGEAGKTILIEEYLEGLEVSVHAFCDGKSQKLCPIAQDHKPVFDGDNGPNTGGMGAIAPVPWFILQHSEVKTIVNKILWAMEEYDRPFSGLLFPGLKVTKDGLKPLEFNARFGDPETQPLMRLLDTDNGPSLLEIFEACVAGTLNEIEIKWRPGFAACIALVSEGYPGTYRKGCEITGIEDAEAMGAVVYQAGTKLVDGKLVTSGGRVLYVTGVGETLEEALDKAYEAVTYIHFDGMHYRTDIGAKVSEMIDALAQ